MIRVCEHDQIKDKETFSSRIYGTFTIILFYILFLSPSPISSLSSGREIKTLPYYSVLIQQIDPKLFTWLQ